MNKYATIGLLLLTVALLIIFRNKLMGLFTSASAQTQGAIVPANNTIAPLDINKILKRGVTGQEVRVLQQYLGITVDGVFGSATENSLFSKKGILQTTLNQYNQLPDAPGGTHDDWDEEGGTDNSGGASWWTGLPYSFMF